MQPGSYCAQLILGGLRTVLLFNYLQFCMLSLQQYIKKKKSSSYGCQSLISSLHHALEERCWKCRTSEAQPGLPVEDRCLNFREANGFVILSSFPMTLKNGHDKTDPNCLIFWGLLVQKITAKFLKNSGCLGGSSGVGKVFMVSLVEMHKPHLLVFRREQTFCSLCYLKLVTKF